jgi:hypothetical protein
MATEMEKKSGFIMGMLPDESMKISGHEWR